MTEQTEAVVARKHVRALTDIQFAVRAEMTLQELGGVFIKSGFWKDLKDASQAIVKVLAGREMGVEPFAAMNGIDIIEGHPALRATLMAGLIKRSGRYRYTMEASPQGARAEWFERDESGAWLPLGETSFTIEDARAANLIGKNNWKAYPEDMCVARTLARGARRFCADLFLGPVYAYEEMEDELPMEAAVQSAGARALQDALTNGQAAKEAPGAPEAPESLQDAPEPQPAPQPSPDPEVPVAKAEEAPHGPVQESPGPTGDLMPPAVRADLLADISKAEALLVFRGGVLNTARTKHAGDADLGNCDNQALGAYWLYLQGEVARKMARQESRKA